MGSCDPYTIGQVATGWTNGGVITGVDYGNGVVSGLGAIGNRGVVYSAGLHGLHHFGKRDADAEPWTVHQVAAGVPLANAALDGRLHNPGVITHVSHGIHGYSGLGYYGKRDADADAYTLGQVYAGLPVHNAYATGHPHNVGYVSHVSYPSVYAYGK